MKFIIPFLSWAAFCAATPESDVSDSKSSARLALLKTRHFNTKKEMAAKKQMLHAANNLRNFKPSFMQQDVVECDWNNEETCYDENFNPIGCEPYADGGCPCPSGQEKCGENLDLGVPGYCTEPEYCCKSDEELCYDENYHPTGCTPVASGGCPCAEGEIKCGGVPEWDIPGYCTEICCSDEEETCYDEMYNPTGCASFNDGGCPCPEGEVKCYTNARQAGTEFFSQPWYGVCSSICCEEGEETCLDEYYNPSSCASIAEGGCDCNGEQVKCYADLEYNYAGYCVDQCCTDQQEACYDYETDGKQTCADIETGGCPCAEGEVKCGAMPEWDYAGYCTELCCQDDEELCYSDDWYPQAESCAPIEGGGCPCKDGEEKCGAMPEINYAGYCTNLCCEEQTCYDWPSFSPSSCVAWDEECPTGVTFDVLKDTTMTMMDQSMTNHQVANFNKVKAIKAKMAADENADRKAIEKMLQAEELAVLLKAKRSGAHKSFNKDEEVLAFMAKVY